MPLCDTCCYGPWDSNNPVTEEDFVAKLCTVDVVPSGEGVRELGVGSPFRAPLPLIIKLCCLDAQMCDRESVNLSAMRTVSEAEVAVNLARSAVYEEAGLPAIGDR